jgi:pilus assembly protein Flp/PilA
MNKLTCFIKDFIKDENGLTAVEYAIAGGLVVGGMVTAFVSLGDGATIQIDRLSCAAQGNTYTDAVVDDPDTEGTDETAAATCN